MEKEMVELDNSQSQVSTVAGSAGDPANGRPEPSTPQTTNGARSEHFLAEDLVLRQLEAESERPIMRYVTVKGRVETAFDGGIVTPSNIKLIEVKHLRNLVPSHLYIQETLQRARNFAQEIANRVSKVSVSLLIAFVAELDADVRSKVASEAESIAGEADIPTEIRVFDFDDLKRRFGVSR